MHVLLVDPTPQPLFDRLKAFFPAHLELQMVSSYAEDEYARLAAQADVLLVLLRRIDARMLALAPHVRFIQRCGVGYDNIDLGAVQAAGAVAAYTPGANAAAVAEHSIMLMLTLLKWFAVAEPATRAGRWPFQELLQAGIGDLASATVGLVGLGSIGQAVAQRLVPFGARLLYTTRRRMNAAVEERLGVTYTSLPELLESASIISLHVPLHEQTRGLIGEAELRRMRRGALLINTSRGELIDEAALDRALRSGHLGGAALDVLCHEAEGGNPFADLPQVIVTPHYAGASIGASQRIMQMAVANVARFASGQEPVDLIPF